MAEHTQPTLRDSLELVLPALPPELVDAQAVPWLRAMAALLPPIHHAGFECRLEPDEPAVDLQQAIFMLRDEPQRLVRFIAEAGAVNEAWAGVSALADRWSTPGDALNAVVREIWLELDADPSAVRDGGGSLRLADARPSVFAVFEDAGAESLSVARDLIRTLVAGDEAAVLDSTVLRLSGFCPESARISHLGLMLGRAVHGLRVHVIGLGLDDLDEYLRLIGWEADRDQVVADVEVLYTHGDWVMLCLDVLGERVMRLGFEWFLHERRGEDPRWQALLDELTARGLSTPEKAAALLRWPATVTPADAGVAWPADLIAEGLAASEDSFGVMNRRLSHVKLTFAPEHAVTAKAYFGFNHVWRAGSGVPDADQRA